MPTCFFIGHRDTPESLLPALSAEVERHITEYGVTEFLVGHYGSFDRLAARAVREAKVRHPAVTLLMLLLYHPALRPVQLPEGFDGSLYLQGMEAVPRRWAIVQSNRQAVDRCDFLIAHAWQPGSNALALVEYARRRGRGRVTVIR